MRRVNLLRPEFDHDLDRPGYRWQAATVGKQLGADQLGATLYVLDEGAGTFPHHFHHAMEELVLVVSGAPVLRSAEGERTLAPGDVVSFPTGPDGAHSLVGPGAVLLISASASLEAIEYPEIGKLGVSPPGKIFRADDAVPYWDGDEGGA